MSFPSKIINRIQPSNKKPFNVSKNKLSTIQKEHLLQEHKQKEKTNIKITIFVFF